MESPTISTEMDTPIHVEVLLSGGGALYTLFLYETEDCVVTRYGCFHKPDLTSARDPSVRLLWNSQISS